MKKVCSLLAFVLCTIFVSSCEDFMDIHKEYIEGGEIIYAPKPDSVAFIAGKERILFFCRVYNAPNVKSVELSWNGGADSLSVPVSFNSSYDSISVVLENLEEKSYTFEVRLVDNFGHSSLTVTDFGTAYGNNYQASLMGRRIKDVSLTDKGATIGWYSAAEGLLANEVKYVRKDGTEEIVRTSSSDFATFCPDAKPGENFEFRSLFIPEAESIDTFYVAWHEYDEAFPDEYVFDRTGWSVLEVSDETASDGGGMNTLLDGDLSTFWHSKYDDGNVALPHWAVIDMLLPRQMSRIELFRRQGSTDTKSAEVFVNDNPDASDPGWLKIARGEFGDGDKLTLVLREPEIAMKGRYLKIVLPESNREPFTNLAEVYVYGR